MSLCLTCPIAAHIVRAISKLYADSGVACMLLIATCGVDLGLVDTSGVVVNIYCVIAERVDALVYIV